MTDKKSLRINMSSVSCWIYMDGDMTKPPIRAFADANCDVLINVEKTPSGEGVWLIPENYVEYSEKHIVKYRKDWDEVDESYGPIPTKAGDSPFIN